VLCTGDDDDKNDEDGRDLNEAGLLDSLLDFSCSRRNSGYVHGLLHVELERRLSKAELLDALLDFSCSRGGTLDTWAHECGSPVQAWGFIDSESSDKTVSRFKTRS
jgi:hypothetical protein